MITRAKTFYDDGQNTEISIAADRDSGEMKKMETPSKIRRVSGMPLVSAQSSCPRHLHLQPEG